MEAKLIKKDNGYYITHESSGWYIGDTDHEKVKNFKGEQGLLKLSFKNCQSIENGYDLDELIEEAIIQVVDKNEQVGLFDIGFLKGFLKALKILGDKKYSEEDMIKCFNASMDDGWVRADFYIQSLQQTEWDVIIEMEYVGKIKLNKLHEMKPKLDADGCLILKRK